MNPLQWLVPFLFPLTVLSSSIPELSDLEATESQWIGVFLCPEHDWKPFNQCYWKKMDIDETKQGQCYNFTDPANSEKMSFGPDRGVWCKVYTGLSCQGEEYRIDYPGTPDLGKFGLSNGNEAAQGNGKFKSFICGQYDCDAAGNCTIHDPPDQGGGSRSER